MNCGVCSACATVRLCSTGALVPLRRRRRLAAGAGAPAQQAGISSAQASDADHQHRRAPVIGCNQPAGERRDRQRRHAHAGRYQRHREAAVVFDPGARQPPSSAHRNRRRQCRSARRTASWNCHRLARPGSPADQAERRAAREPISTTMRVPIPVGQRAPEEGGKPHDEEVERHRRRHARCATSPSLREIGCRNTASDNIAPKRDAGHQRACGDDDPAVVEPRWLCPASQRGVVCVRETMVAYPPPSRNAVETTLSFGDHAIVRCVRLSVPCARPRVAAEPTILWVVHCLSSP